VIGSTSGQRDVTVTYDEVCRAFAGTGLSVRGGLVLSDADRTAWVPSVGGDAASVVLLGNFGGALWENFGPEHTAGNTREEQPNPLDTWTAHVVAPRAVTLGATPRYPNDKPYAPFLAWAQRAEPVHPSPLGLLIHPMHGLWHAYRAALVFRHVLHGLPAREEAVSPCDTCVDRPCLEACPVAAFDGARFDVAACATHLETELGAKNCLDGGCQARAACPVGTPYPPGQVRFHMAAFHRARRRDLSGS